MSAATPLRVLIAGIGGVGGTLARRLVLRGTAVHLVARSADKLGALEATLRELGATKGHHHAGLVSTSVADALSEADMERAAREAAEGGLLTGWCYAVGSIPLKPFRATSPKDMMDAYALNVVGGATLLRGCLPALTKGPAPGSAVFFSSVAAQVGFPSHAAIASAKGGVEALVRSLAAELAPKLRVNAIAPSLSDTPLASRMLATEASRKALGDAHPLPRVGTTDDQAAAAEFLLDHKWSSWVSGQVWSVDGGRSTLRPKN